MYTSHTTFVRAHTHTHTHSSPSLQTGRAFPVEALFRAHQRVSSILSPHVSLLGHHPCPQSPGTRTQSPLPSPPACSSWAVLGSLSTPATWGDSPSYAELSVPSEGGLCQHCPISSLSTCPFLPCLLLQFWDWLPRSVLVPLPLEPSLDRCCSAVSHSIRSGPRGPEPCSWAEPWGRGRESTTPDSTRFGMS